MLKLATVNGRRVSHCRVVDLTPAALAAMADMQTDPSLIGTRDPEMQARACIQGLSFATVDDDMLISALGVLPIWPGRALGWMFTAPNATRRQLVYTVRQARLRFDMWSTIPQLRRIEIMIRADQPWRESFARALGMNEAFGPMKAFDSLGRDYFMYARVA